MNKALSTLGLCRRAGKLIAGFDAVKDEMKKKTAGGVVMTSDVSPKTEKEARYFAEKYGARVIKQSFTMDEAAAVLGKRAGIYFVTDEGLYKVVARE